MQIQTLSVANLQFALYQITNPKYGIKYPKKPYLPNSSPPIFHLVTLCYNLFLNMKKFSLFLILTIVAVVFYACNSNEQDIVDSINQNSNEPTDNLAQENVSVKNLIEIAVLENGNPVITYSNLDKVYEDMNSEFFGELTNFQSAYINYDTQEEFYFLVLEGISTDINETNPSIAIHAELIFQDEKFYLPTEVAYDAGLVKFKKKDPVVQCKKVSCGSSCSYWLKCKCGPSGPGCKRRTFVGRILKWISWHFAN